MDALLLAAGRGSRLAPITDRVPKCLVTIQGRPLLDYWLDSLIRFKQTHRVFLNINYLADQVKAYLFDSPFYNRVSLLSEEILLGTGGTLVRLLKQHGPFHDDMLVAHADNFSIFSLDSFFNRHRNRPRGCIATVLTFVSDTPEECGVLEVNDKGVVQSFHEKVKNPPGQLASGAIFLFSPEALKLIANFGDRDFSNVTPDGIFDLSRDFLPNVGGLLYTFNEALYHRDIGTHRALAQVREDAHRLNLRVNL
jgi:mannose-1-phosphate guanylyltransferase